MGPVTHAKNNTTASPSASTSALPSVLPTAPTVSTANMSTPASTTTPMISSVLPITVSSDVPHLDPEGANWAVFTFCFQRAMILAGCWDYFDGSDTCPIPNDLSNITDTEKLDCKQWDH